MAETEPTRAAAEEIDQAAGAVQGIHSPAPPRVDSQRARELNLVRRVALRLHRPLPPAPMSPPVARGEENLQRVPGWVDALANVISYGLVFYGAVIAAHWLGKDNFLIALGLLAIAWMLRDYLIEPLRRLVREIVLSIFLTVLELVEFFFAWVRSISEHGFRTVLQAIVRMVILAAFMWVWELAQGIPAIRQLLDFVVNTARQITRFINDQLDRVLGLIDDLRRRTLDLVDSVTQGLGQLGQALRQELTGIVNGLFRGLAREIQDLRFDLLARFDVLRQLTRAEIEILGIRIRLVPQAVIDQLRERLRARPLEPLTSWGDAILIAGPLPPAPAASGVLPWETVDVAVAEALAAARGEPNELALVVDEQLALLTAAAAGRPVALEPADYRELLRTVPGPPPPGVSPQLARPEFVDPVEWSFVVQTCTPPPHLAPLVAAIGWHETRWGTAGAGRDGYILGVGVTSAGPDPAFQGLDRQVAWACPRLARAFPSPEFGQADVERFSREIWRPGNPAAWAASVFSIYRELVTRRA